MNNRKATLPLLIGLLLTVMNHAAQAAPSFWSDLKQDHRHFYSLSNLAWIGGGLAIGGAMANTDVDADFQDYYRDEVHSEDTDDAAKIAKMFGDRPVVLLYAGLSLLDPASCDSGLCSNTIKWGQRSFRSVIVGLPPVWLSQYTLGGNRPEEGPSDWTPFEDTNAVSGHSFVGAVPFLTAAEMSDNILLKSLLYAGSLATGWSRINDERHYLSQALLGWWYAYRTAQSVERTESQQQQITVSPFIQGEYTGLTLKVDF